MGVLPGDVEKGSPQDADGNDNESRGEPPILTHEKEEYESDETEGNPQRSPFRDVPSQGEEGEFQAKAHLDASNHAWRHEFGDFLQESGDGEDENDDGDGDAGASDGFQTDSLSDDESSHRFHGLDGHGNTVIESGEDEEDAKAGKDPGRLEIGCDDDAGEQGEVGANITERTGEFMAVEGDNRGVRVWVADFIHVFLGG